MCDLMSASIRIGSSWSKDYGKNVCYLRCCSIYYLRANRCPSEIQRGYSHLRRARAPEGPWCDESLCAT